MKKFWIVDVVKHGVIGKVVWHATEEEVEGYMRMLSGFVWPYSEIEAHKAEMLFELGVDCKEISACQTI